VRFDHEHLHSCLERAERRVPSRASRPGMQQRISIVRDESSSFYIIGSLPSREQLKSSLNPAI
jgi:hypothetical protein